MIKDMMCPGVNPSRACEEFASDLGLVAGFTRQSGFLNHLKQDITGLAYTWKKK